MSSYTTEAPGFSPAIRTAFREWMVINLNKTRFSDDKHWLYKQILLFPDAKAPPIDEDSEMDPATHKQYYVNRKHDALTNYEIFEGLYWI